MTFGADSPDRGLGEALSQAARAQHAEEQQRHRDAIVAQLERQNELLRVRTTVWQAAVVLLFIALVVGLAAAPALLVALWGWAL